MALIELRDIVKTYAHGEEAVRVLHGISLDIEEGEFVAIMGPSGSGKSTLMNILGGLDTPTSGEYRLDGRDMSALGEDELAYVRSEKIGFVFQAFHLLPRSTVMRNVLLPLIYADHIPANERRERAERALAAADMPKERWNHYSNELSGGQIQRVAIARALVNTPRIILADEPTGNLDSKTGQIVLDTFRRLNQEGRTILLITHERDVAEQANRIVHIKDGLVLKDERL